MTPRLKILLVLMLALGALALMDRPAPDAPEVSEGVTRTPRPAAAAAKVLLAAAPVALFADTEDAPVPDLFAGAQETAAASTPAAPAASGSAPPTQAPHRPFTLLGFKVEDGQREAYLLQDGADVVAVHAGSVLQRRYRVLAVDEDTVGLLDNASGARLRVGFEDHP